MKFCPHCKVQLEADPERCPLCHNVTEPALGPSYRAYPPLPVLAHRGGLYRFLQFLSAVAGIVAVALNLSLGHEVWWSLFVLAGIGCGWLCLLVFIRKRHNPMKVLVWQVALCMVLSVLWDLATGWHRWSVEFVIPSVLLCAMVTTVVLVLALHIPPAESAIYAFILILLDIIPLGLLLGGVCHFVYLSITCVAAGAVYLAAPCMLIPGTFFSQLRRRFHL